MRSHTTDCPTISYLHCRCFFQWSWFGCRIFYFFISSRPWKSSGLPSNRLAFFFLSCSSWFFTINQFYLFSTLFNLPSSGGKKKVRAERSYLATTIGCTVSLSQQWLKLDYSGKNVKSLSYLLHKILLSSVPSIVRLASQWHLPSLYCQNNFPSSKWSALTYKENTDILLILIDALRLSLSTLNYKIFIQSTYPSAYAKV